MSGIRFALPEDAEGSGAVHCASRKETCMAIFPEICADLTPERCSEIFRSRGCRDVLISEKDGKIVGFCAFGVSGGEGEIAGLYILRSAQNEGRGTALLKAAGEELKKRGVSRVRLRVAEADRRAMNFCRGRGFMLSSHEKQGRIAEAEMTAAL